MTNETNQLIQLFSKALHSPRMMQALHQEMARRQIENRSGRNGARGLLVALWEKDGLTNSEIAELLDIRPSSVTAQVKQLEERGFIERRADENDGRISRVFLTEVGRELKNQRQERRGALSESLFTRLTEEEQKALIQLLTKMLENDEFNQDFDGFDPRQMWSRGRDFRRMMKEEMRGHQAFDTEHFGGSFPGKSARGHQRDNWDDF